MKIADEGMGSVRGIAALVVVIAHAVQIFIIRLVGLDHVVAKTAGLIAANAVFVFFVVSGYLITLSIIKNSRRNDGVFNMIEYASARISRIYPPLIFAIFTCLTLWLLMRLLDLPGNDSPGASIYGLPNDLYVARNVFSIKLGDITNALLMNNGLLQVDGPLWSLCVEWRIYIVAGCLAMLITSKSSMHKFFWGCVLLLSLIKLKAVDGNAYFYSLIWLAGSGVAIGHTSKLEFKMLPRKLFWVAPLSIMVVVGFCNPEFLLSSRNLSDFRDRAFQFVCCLFWLGVLFPRADYRETYFRYVLMRLGDFSYTLFIIHFPVMLFFLSLSQNIVGHSIVLSVLAALFSTGVALVFSCYAGRFIERKDFVMPIIQMVIQQLVFMFRRTLSMR